jgi:D-glucosaminate-6-phosphate ammonia-lyase
MGNSDSNPLDKDYSPAEAILNSLGISSVISASGTVTRYGGSRLRPEIMDAMLKASNTMVNIDDLNVAAGKMIAKYTGAEAGLVTSGAAGGLVLQAAAVIAGNDPAKMKKLPNTKDMKNEIIIHKSHRFPYDQCYLSAGARFVEIGDGRRCNQWELESAFTDETAAVAYLFSPFITRRALPFRDVCEIAHERSVPVIVDAASYTPPRANLTKFISEGADMVIYSGGKGVKGPQGTGILCGREDLIEAAYANASPHQFIGRGMKVAKEEIIGLVKALEIFVDEDEGLENREYTKMSERGVDALIEIPGISAEVVHDEYDYLIPTTLITFKDNWEGKSRDEICNFMIEGDPPIYLSDLGDPDTLAIDPFNLTEPELDIVIERLHKILTST